VGSRATWGRILALGQNHTDQGLDAGSHTICWHLAKDPDSEDVTVSPATI
jgi:hypothetical protein